MKKTKTRKRNKPNPPLDSIGAELAACRKAWKPYMNGTKWRGKLAWCCHHLKHIELLTENPRNRINYIARHKNINEKAARFRTFRPVKTSPVTSRYERLARQLGELDAKRDRANYTSRFEFWNQKYYTVKDRLKAATPTKTQLIKLHDQQWSDNAWTGRKVLTTH